MLRITVAVQATLVHALHRRRDDRGQTTAEYALVLLGAAAVALLVLAWATKTDRITKLLNSVIDRVLAQVP
jgi:hypothetical protein